MDKATTFTYDGLSRRISIANTPAGGGTAVTVSYIWCGSEICQARDATNAVTRQYLAEGEYVPGSPGQSYFYGIDRIGTVRRVFASTGGTPAYAFDPYGVPLQATAPLTDFGYSGMFQEQASGLALTQFRAYDPKAGRWLSRDPLGEQSAEGTNLYAYVMGNPVSFIDPLGLQCHRNGGAPTPKFLPPTNPPRMPPTDLPPGHSIRKMPPTEQYPDGYWRQYNANGQPVDPSTGKPPSNVSSAEARAQTHVPLPPETSNIAPADVGPTRPFVILGPVGAFLCLVFCDSPAY